MRVSSWADETAGKMVDWKVDLKVDLTVGLLVESKGVTKVDLLAVWLVLMLAELTVEMRA